MIGISPNRLTSEPVTKPGANIDTEWDEITVATEPKPWPLWASMATGAAVMRKFITLCATVADTAATTNTGCLMISSNGRCSPSRCALVRFGMSRNSSTTAASSPVPTMNRNAPAKRWPSSSPFPQFARLGPRNPANTPPASTREMALGRNSFEAASATANR